MDHVIYTAMGGAKNALIEQSIVAHNIANISTSGFKAQLSAARAVPIHGDSEQTRTLIVASTPGIDMSQGTLNYTVRAMDVALNEQHFLTVELADGTEAYTRNGHIQMSSKGEFVIGKHRLLGDSGIIGAPENANISIATDGTVNASLSTGDYIIGRLKIVQLKPHDLLRGDDGLFHLSVPAKEVNGQQLPQSSEVALTSGAIENSNVNAAESVVSMIDNARYFEMQMKIISSADKNAQKANQLLAIS